MTGDARRVTGDARRVTGDKNGISSFKQSDCLAIEQFIDYRTLNSNRNTMFIFYYRRIWKMVLVTIAAIETMVE